MSNQNFSQNSEGFGMHGAGTVYPEDVYRLAIIVQGMMESLDNPSALETIRFELQTLINEISFTPTGH